MSFTICTRREMLRNVDTAVLHSHDDAISCAIRPLHYPYARVNRFEPVTGLFPAIPQAQSRLRIRQILPVVLMLARQHSCGHGGCDAAPVRKLAIHWSEGDISELIAPIWRVSKQDS